MGRDAEFARPNRFRLRARRFALNLPCSCAARRLQWSPFVVASWYAFGALLPRPSGVAVILSVLAFAGSALAQVPAPALPTDHTLAELIHDSLSARPELSQALAVARAQEERVSQA